jgi:hypothetical protein
MCLQRSATVWLAPADTNKTRRVVSPPPLLLLHPPFSLPGWSLKVFSFYVTTSPNLPKWEKRRSKNWGLSELPFSLLSHSLAGDKGKKPLLLQVLLFLLLCCNKIAENLGLFSEIWQAPK